MNWYKFARVMNDLSAILNPKRAPRRLRNKIVGRALGRVGVWRRLWR